MNIINSSYLPNQNQYSINTDTVRYNDKTANNVPNGLLRVPEAQPNKNITNNLLSDNLRKIYTPRLAPSAGSLTENVLKSRASMAPIFKHNEAATKYDMISMAPLFLKQIKKHIDIIV